MRRLGEISDFNCDYSFALMYKPNGSTYVGQQMYYHVVPYSPHWFDIYARNGTGYKNSAAMGYLADDDYEEPNCGWDGAHVHQDAQLNLAVVTGWGRGAYPTEAQCHGCLWPKTIWTDWHIWYRYNY
jgi:hypothetical protein